MRLDPTLARFVVHADQSVVNFIGAFPCTLFARGLEDTSGVRIITFAHAYYTIAYKGNRTVERHNRMSCKYLIHRMAFVCVERDSAVVLVQLFFLLPASLNAVEVRQTSFSVFRCLSTVWLGVSSLPSSSSPAHMLPQHGIMIPRQISCTICTITHNHARLLYPISVTSVTHNVNTFCPSLYVIGFIMDT